MRLCEHSKSVSIVMVPRSFCFDEGDMYSGFSHEELSKLTSSRTRVRSAWPVECKSESACKTHRLLRIRILLVYNLGKHL